MCANDVKGLPHLRAVCLADLSGPLQLHHGSIDKVVPVSFSESLYQQLRVAGKPAELYLYPLGDHNIRVGFDEAMQRTLWCFEARHSFYSHARNTALAIVWGRTNQLFRLRTILPC